MADNNNPGEVDVADFTHARMRRIEQIVARTDTKLDKVLEILVRHETRITRMERDIGEIKFDLTSSGTHMVALTTDMLKLTDKIDTLGEKMDGLDRRVANIEGGFGTAPASPSSQG